ARGPRRGLARCRRGRRRAGQPRPRRPAVAARGLPARGAKHPAPAGRPAGPHLHPRPRRAPVHAGRAREGARGDGPRALLAVSPTFGRTSSSAIDSVLLIAFGGPTAPAEIRPFLANVGRGRNIPRERLEEVARHYEAMPGGRSPLNALTEAQAAGLRAALVRGGRPLPVYVGMRNWHPFLHETLAAMAADGRRRAVGLILSAFRSEASWERYAADVAPARATVAGADTRGGCSRTRAGAAARAIRGSSPTSARRSATSPRPASGAWSWRRSASSSITSRCSTTSTPRRARSPRSTGSPTTARRP